VIRVLVVDDHLAIRAGLVALLRAEPGFVVAGAADAFDDALSVARRSRPDVALVDYHLAAGDGLSLTLRLGELEEPPRVLLYSAFASEALAVAATIAGAHGMLAKGAPADELFAALRAVARGDTSMPAIPPAIMEASAARVAVEDLPILGMRMDRTAPDDIAGALAITPGEVQARLGAMVGRLAVRVRV
jgi:DNA-binding NarL/FixJ family response regulator